MWLDFEKGKYNLYCKTFGNGIAKIIYFKSDDSSDPPFALWGRIFQWLGGNGWRIFWFPSETKRILPSNESIIGPANINGGYCIPCRHDQIVIYRKEEATRVLIHELLHASCLDPHDAILPLREASTEMWAELFLVAILSEGSEEKAESLWKIQSEWIANQNALLKSHYNIKTPNDFAWRYTVGREVILHSLKIELPRGYITKATKSGRLTSPRLLCKSLQNQI